MTEITVLIEDKKDGASTLHAEKGLSLLVRNESGVALFDMGQSGRFIDNAERLGIDIKDIEVAVISHGHFDHSGGLSRFLKENSKATVYMKEAALEPKYANFYGLKKYVGISDEAGRHRDRIKLVNGVTEVIPGMFLVANINRMNPLASNNSIMLVKRDGKMAQDTFEDELFLVVNDEDGLVVVTGCSHTGAKNMIRTARLLFDGKNVKALVGGLHMSPGFPAASLSKDDVELMAERLYSEAVEKVYAGHCTGERGIEQMRPVLGDAVKGFHTGAIIRL